MKRENERINEGASNLGSTKESLEEIVCELPRQLVGTLAELSGAPAGLAEITAQLLPLGSRSVLLAHGLAREGRIIDESTGRRDFLLTPKAYEAMELAALQLSGPDPELDLSLEELESEVRTLLSHGSSRERLDLQEKTTGFSDSWTKTNLSDWATHVKKKLYEGRVDRAIFLLVGSLALLTAAFVAIAGVRIDQTILVACILGLIGMHMSQSAIQSGRTRFQTRLVQEDTARNVALSAQTKLIEGHDKCHAMEKRIAEDANRELLILELWDRARQQRVTRWYREAQEAVVRRLNDDPNFRVLAAVGSTEFNWEQCREVLKNRMSSPNATQRFYFDNPLQVDVMISDKEALLSLPHGDGDREYAVHISGPELVDKLRQVMETNVWKSSGVKYRNVEGFADLKELDSLVAAEKLARTPDPQSGPAVYQEWLREQASTYPGVAEAIHWLSDSLRGGGDRGVGSDIASKGMTCMYEVLKESVAAPSVEHLVETPDHE